VADDFPEIIGKRMEAAFKAALIRACIELRDLIREKISVQGTRKDRSEDGQPPRLQSGNLWRSYKWIVSSNALTAADGDVFSDPAIAPYMKFVEEGTGRMGARPHYYDTIEEYDFAGHVKMYFAEELESPSRVFGGTTESD
jgi:hypothetical protein